MCVIRSNKITQSFPKLRCVNMRILISSIFLLSLEVFAVFHEDPNSPVVHTKTGKIQGKRKIHNGRCIDVYYGIPFAKPPVGNLRFRTTVPVEKWKGILKATVKGPACPQDKASLDADLTQSEDCLNLNIWAPCRKGKKPVMVYIYGGNFTVGSGAMSVYDGTEIAASGNVITVTLNYRLGIFGFSFSNTDDAPGNAGMYDQAEALKWIHDNIEYFGGNPSSITLFGQSSGSISVSLHTVSPISSNLFHRVIMQSGSSALLLIAYSPAISLKSTDTVAKAVNCSDSENNIETQPKAVMDCMRKINYQVLLNNSDAPQYGPKYGDRFMPNDPRLEIIKGNFKNCDRIMGGVSDEGSLFWARAFINIYGSLGEKIQHPTLNKTDAYPMMRKVLLGFAIPPSDVDSIIKYYLSKVAGDGNEEVVRQAYTATGDNIMLCPSVYEAEKASQRNKIYFYKFDHKQTYTNRGAWMGVSHFTDVPFVFGLPLSQTQMKFTEEEKKLSKRIIKMWTNFAKGRSPSSNAESWPTYSRERPFYLSLNTTKRFVIRQGPHRDNCNFLRKFHGFQ